MTGPRWTLAVAAAVLVAAGAIGIAAAVDDDAAGRLVMGDEVPDDLRALAAETFGAFEERFAARLDCMTDVHLVPVWEGLGDRAMYLPELATIQLRVPATANLLADSLVHELAHHLEFTCPEHGSLRPAFLAAQGHPAGAEWFIADRWEDTPSEQFAEAVVQLVLGTRQQHVLAMRITEEAVAVVGAWGRG
jgi:hypothetical protein